LRTIGWYPFVVRILVTNDDGVDAPGLAHLAQALTSVGDVIVIAPDREFSGAGASIGAIWDYRPEVARRQIDGISEVWALNGPPALCVMYARFGAFGGPFDLVVSGINPGANVGRSVYYSGTVGACLAARNGGWSGIAVSQAITQAGLDGSVDGQAWAELVKLQKFETAATVAKAFTAGFVRDRPREPVVVNINVPNTELSELRGWAHTEVGSVPPRAMSTASLIPIGDDPDRFTVDIGWGDATERPEGSDAGAIQRNMVSVSYLTRLEAESDTNVVEAEASLDRLLR
jgi:5'-nucleotidase